MLPRRLLPGLVAVVVMFPEMIPSRGAADDPAASLPSPSGAVAPDDAAPPPAAHAAQPNRADRVATGQHPADVEARLDERMREAVRLLYESRLADAARVAEEARDATPDDPRVYLLEARVLRESWPDQNFVHDRQRTRAAPIDAALTRAIETSEALVRQDSRSLPGHLYRGWAHLFRAQLRALSGEFWPAGREAKAGKDDLDRVLELAPDDPDARGVLGTYLYFADILPGVVKFARALVRVPGGDRDRGLRDLRFAAQHDGYDQLDAEAILATIEFAFDGRFDDAADAFGAMARRFPNNARLLEPLAVLALYQPQRASLGLEQLERAVQVGADNPEDWNRQLSLRLRLYEALAQMLYGRYDEARANLEVVQHAAPPDPDWLFADACLALADLHLLLGEAAPARALHAGNAGHTPLQERLSYVLAPDAAATAEEAAVLRRAQPAAQALYAGRLQEAERGLAALDGTDDPTLNFWRGDLALLSGRLDQARAHYERLTSSPLPARWRIYRFMAFARLAELSGIAGNTKSAANVLGRGLDSYQDRDLLRHVMKARRRYFDLGGGSGGGAARTSDQAPAHGGESR